MYNLRFDCIEENRLWLFEAYRCLATIISAFDDNYNCGFGVVISYPVKVSESADFGGTIVPPKSGRLSPRVGQMALSSYAPCGDFFGSA